MFSRKCAFLLIIVGGSCLWSPARMNLLALDNGIKILGIVAREASSTITTSKFVLVISSIAAVELVDKIISLLLIMSFTILFSSFLILS